MLNDQRRNAAYQKAIERHVHPGVTVFEIGTGAGLLALIAARAGAFHVYTCESSSAIAQSAQEIVRQHGYQDQITVINRTSSDVRVGVEVPEKVDLIISEIFGNDLLSQGCVDYVGDARERLLKPSGHILPRRAAIVACLIESRYLCKTLSMPNCTLDFDLSRFNALSPRRVDANNELFFDRSRYRLLSDPFLVQTYELGYPFQEKTRKKVLRVQVKKTGFAHGLLQWNRIFLDEDVSIENHPADGVEISGWERIFHFTPEVGEIRGGEWVELGFSNDGRVSRFH